MRRTGRTQTGRLRNFAGSFAFVIRVPTADSMELRGALRHKRRSVNELEWSFVGRFFGFRSSATRNGTTEHVSRVLLGTGKSAEAVESLANRWPQNSSR